MGKKLGFGSGMNNPYHIFRELKKFLGVNIFKFCDVDPGYGMEKIRIRDGKVGSGIRDGKKSDPG
jgi:hypothetical protein